MNKCKCKTPSPSGYTVMTLSPDSMRRSLSRINARKALGPDNIPGHVLRDCAVELIDVFTDIFIPGDPTHPTHSFFSLLPSGRRLWSLQARTSRLKDSFIHQAVRKINSRPPPPPSFAPRFTELLPSFYNIRICISV